MESKTDVQYYGIRVPFYTFETLRKVSHYQEVRKFATFIKLSRTKKILEPVLFYEKVIPTTPYIAACTILAVMVILKSFLYLQVQTNTFQLKKKYFFHTLMHFITSTFSNYHLSSTFSNILNTKPQTLPSPHIKRVNCLHSRYSRRHKIVHYSRVCIRIINVILL